MKYLLLCFAVLVALITCCPQEVTTYRIPRRTFDNLIQSKFETSKYNARFIFTSEPPLFPRLNHFMFMVPAEVRQQVWGALDLMITEPNESYECLVSGNECIEAGIFLFLESCPMIHLFYDSGSDPRLWQEAAIATRGWRNDTGYIFVYDHHYVASNLEMPIYTHPSSSNEDNGNTLTYLDTIPYPIMLNLTMA